MLNIHLRATVSFRLLIYSTNSLKWDVTRVYLIKLFLGSNDKNGYGMQIRQSKNRSTRIVWNISMQLQEWNKTLEIGFSNGIDPIFDQIYHGYLVNVYKRVYAQREMIHYLKALNTTFLLSFYQIVFLTCQWHRQYFCTISSKQDDTSISDSLSSKWSKSCAILATLSQSEGPGWFKFSVFEVFIMI